jgi:hypothetical protein
MRAQEAASPRSSLETSLPGLFAARDVRSRSTKRVTSAVGEGAMAIHLVHERYVSRITRGRSTLREGPSGLIDVSNGESAAGGAIDAAFTKIIAFVDRNEPLIRRQDPFSFEGVLPMFRRMWHGE